MNDHIERTGRALDVLWTQFNACRFIAKSKSSAFKKFALKLKTEALIEHDRILRGDA